MVLIAAMIIGGFLAVWVLQGIIDWAITSRFMENPLNGKILATIAAYFLAALLYWMSRDTMLGFATYLPGAILVGIMEVRGARKVQARIDAQDQTSTFE
ncbi:hypothetical protein [Erythrobacter sp. F6033]|uniref:hypothetical protein n=1 Tax=Erythrobacter sp. F6033 TaxID=2926401 RepID=UPI001FF6F2F2|nr:hypothetical protein [Erythrobacter sp. F6033]MCK0128960.1 hypothetical protein [Erythrobacter sp. F6033]